ncbi:helix-turn-helix domain-containing protein [Micromonospora sp. LOL_021]|uniref:helix-turn-helix domain-containing protein n=1 Tax=Micromonospora sp. LOL_021 TaxID=3345417 RepID=UPI003A89C7B3
MQLRYQFRVYPTPGQQIALARAFGCARVVFNDGLRLRQTAHEQGLPYISDAELSKRVITRAKTTPERAWLGEVSGGGVAAGPRGPEHRVPHLLRLDHGQTQGPHGGPAEVPVP